jgi:hypothetical protein
VVVGVVRLVVVMEEVRDFAQRLLSILQYGDHE